MDQPSSSLPLGQRQEEEGSKAQHPHLHALIPPSATPPPRTASSTPMTSPGLFSPTSTRPRANFSLYPASDSNTPLVESHSPYLHPLHNHKVRETHKALIDSDSITGRKLINQYEVIEEIGRGMHGKVKLARNLETGDNVAIKIIPRYSKKRRLGKVMAMSPQDKTMREIAILKKMRHPNVVSLLEIIDDPELRKIYLILEHVELGEIIWRKKGLPQICQVERRRIEREMRGEAISPEEEQYDQLLEHRRAIRELKRAKMSQTHAHLQDYWSIEHGVSDEASSGAQSRIPSGDDLALLEHPVGSAPHQASLPSSLQASRATSRAPSRAPSIKSSAGRSGLTSRSMQLSSSPDDTSDMETPGPQRSSTNGSAAALDGTMYGAYIEEGTFRGRSPSMADSIISHMSSVDWNPRAHDPFAEDFSYVPCFTLEQARSIFRDTVLGLEYLHYQGVVHRDIKPANLLWTKDHRVKISDFGVSYFGRPIRGDGEPEDDDDGVSESEAQDFDDDLELAKTVGTPAFFAPELCYTDSERTQVPKISEMIDIWSLGVTLYCIVYARIPFQAEDEWVMFKKIAHEDVFIPKKRLRPVDPSTNPDGTSLYKRQNQPPYRDDNDMVYEDIDPLLQDLLRLMFTKNPEKRVRLKDIKRHPWVMHGIPNPGAWLEETDPARPSQGRRVQVDAKETAHAVVPITFLERARSTLKKAVGKVMHPLVSERSDSKSRRRATSSVASSAGDSMHPMPPAAHLWDRRKSIRGDDYFSNIRDFALGSDHPLSQSVAAASSDVGYDPLATTVPPPPASTSNSSYNETRRVSQDANAYTPSATTDEPLASISPPAPTKTVQQRHSNLASQFLALTQAPVPPPEAKTVPTTPFGLGPTSESDWPCLSNKDESAQDDLTRSQSVDRELFSTADRHAQPTVGLTTAKISGTVLRGHGHGHSHGHGHVRPARSIDLGKSKAAGPSLASPLFFSSHAITGYQNGRPESDSNIYEGKKGLAHGLEERPQTAHRVERIMIPEARTPPPRTYNTSNSASFARAKEELQRRQILEYQQDLARRLSTAKINTNVDPADVPCPSSPDDEDHPRVSRESTMETAKSSRSTSMAGLTTPMTSPSEVASPISTSAFPSKEQILAFQSDPSLPALLSGASSVSAELETELPIEMDHSIVNGRPDLLQTTDSLTPPALLKEPIAGFPIEHMQMESQSGLHRGDCDNGVIAVQLDPVQRPRSMASFTSETYSMDDYDDDSDSDEGLVMAKSKKKKPTSVHHHNHTHAVTDRTPFGVHRRDTNISITSTETAKRYAEHGDETKSLAE